MLTEAEFLAAVLRYFGLSEALLEALRSDQSHEQLRVDLERALNAWAERPASPDNTIGMGVLWVFDDRLIAYQWHNNEMRGRIWEIPWTRGADGTFTFGAPVEVKEVHVFEPVAESRRAGSVRMSESIAAAMGLAPVQEGAKGERRIRAIGMTADIVNGNGRRYPRSVLAAAIEHLNKHLHESAGQGRLVATGEVEHPSDKGTGRPNLLETVIKWEAASLDAAGTVLLEGVILPTSKGKDLATLVEHGVPVGISMRGYGTSETVSESVNGQKRAVQQVKELWITGWDAVMEPSDGAARIVESQQRNQERNMTLEEMLKMLNEQPAMRDAIIAKLGLADKASLAETLGVKPEELGSALEEAQKAKVELARRRAQEAVEAAIADATKGLRYGDRLNGLFVESVRAAKPATAEAVTGIVEAKRKEYDGIVSAATLAGMGRVEVLGPVFERETGQPEFAKPAWALTESLVKGGHVRRRELAKAEDSASLFAQRYLERFDQHYKAQLLAEATLFNEAEQTSDLNLPYSVMRAIVEQVWPEVIAANVFDFGIASQAPERLYFETYVGETGASAVAITDEVVTGDHDNWVQLAHTRLNPGSVVLTNSGATVTYTEGTDYVMDYGKGQLRTLSAGTTTDGQSLKIDYTYEAMRKGEMSEIERAKNTLSYKTLDIAADRLSTQISREAIVFSRSQLGYDAVGRTIANLVRKIQRKIDTDIIYLAIAAAAQQASNSGGSWTASSGSLDDLVKYLGVAKTKVANRYYTPQTFLMSSTNADRLSNWAGFKRDGFPDATLNAAGFAGNVKGLSVFSSPVMSDGYILVVNRELVMHRVFSPMQLMGPFPSYSNGKLVSADQYYVEEFNGTDAPVVEKGAYVKVV